MVQGIAERFVGSSVKRVEDRRILTGSGRYVDDIKLPGMLHAVFLRSPFAHARIRSIDVTAARQLPGVAAVFSGEEMQLMVVAGPGLAAMFMPDAPSPAFTLLATDKVRLVGDLVALVVAETRALGEDACELIDVDYDPLPAIASAEHALDPSRPAIFEDLGSNVLSGPTRNTYGDVDGVFASADRVITASIRQHRHQNVPMETRGTVVSHDPATDELTIYAATQGVGPTKMLMGMQLAHPLDKIRVLAGDIGGSFGLKFGAAREEVAVAAAAKALGRPIKWIEDRNENLVASGQARDECFEVEAAVTNQGDVLGLKVKMVLDTGAYPGLGMMIGGIVERMIPSCFKIAALDFETTTVVTNKASYVAYRGPWAAETFVRERLFDLIARELGMEPIALRLRNVVSRGEPPLQMITGQSLAGVTSRESLERMALAVDVPAFRKQQHEARAEGRYLGLGLATYIEAAPGPREPGGGGGVMGNEMMRMRLERDGTISVFTSQMPHGQGHQTTLAQVAADEFGLPFERVNVVVGDSSVVPEGFGTGGSRSAVMAGGSALHTARKLRTRVLELASHILEISPEDLEIVDGVVAARGVPSRTFALADVAAAAEQADSVPTGVDRNLEVENGFDGGEGGWAGGTHAAIVEVDIETGLVSFERYVVAEDCGVIINPAIVEGQVRGGIAQGIGAVLLELSAYDDEGQYLSGSFMDYLLPTACDVPRVEIHHLETVPLDADVNFRGVGEGGMIVSPPTICNAIEDALAPLGVRIFEQHLPPARLLELIEAAQSR
ncbi:MAG: Carbon-monoxide dehydrogenase (acceptor) [Acidimicrobiales bacterium]|nr:Carbon-monoxide dehydrogenase (acceptor) [Acidimicrobiales bacterium]